MTKSCRGSAIKIMLLACVFPGAHADDPSPFRGGTIDETFGDNGHQIVDLVQFDRARQLALSGSGDIFLSGSSTPENAVEQPMLYRFDENGGNQIALTYPQEDDECPAAPGSFFALIADGNGGLLAAGDMDCVGDTDFLVIRTDQEGVHQQRFERPAFNGETESVRRLFLQNSGRVVALGVAISETSDVAIVAAGYHSDGTLDSEFGIAGESIIADNRLPSIASAALHSDDGIVITATGSPGFAVMRLSANGNLDTAFGENGVATASYASGRSSESARDVAVQPDGKIVVVGVTSAAFGINLKIVSSINAVRFDADGSIDKSFGNNGLASTGPLLGNAAGKQLIVEPDGRLLIVGNTVGNTVPSVFEDLILVRLQPDGTLDRSFAQAGRAVIDFSRFQLDSPSSLLAMPNEALVIAGTSTDFFGLDAIDSDIGLTRIYWRQVIFDNGFGKSVD